MDLLVVYGNAWQSDYLRYATDYGILEGEGLAVVRRDGETTLYLDSPLEADRAAVEAPGIDVVFCALDAGRCGSAARTRAATAAWRRPRSGFCRVGSRRARRISPSPTTPR